MKVIVMNKKDAVSYSYKPDIPSTAIISISSVGEKKAKFCKDNPRIKYVLPLKFDDVDSGDSVITKAQCRQIIGMRYTAARLGCEVLLVHCEAGISRSSAVAAAILKITEGNDKEIFDNPKYRPNMRVYNSIMKEWYKIKLSEKYGAETALNAEKYLKKRLDK